MKQELLTLTIILSLLLSIVVVGNRLTPQATAQDKGGLSNAGLNTSNFTNSSESVKISPQGFTLNYTNNPVKLTPEQLNQSELATFGGADREEVPSKITNTSIQGPLPGTETKPSLVGINQTMINNTGIKHPNVSANLSGADPPGDVHIWTNSQVQSGSMVSEPSAAGPKRDTTVTTTTTTSSTSTTTTTTISHNLIVFYTANWFVSRSTDGGTTWTYTNPYGDMPDFCCDQDVIFHNDPNPNNQIFIWYRQASCAPPSNVQCNTSGVNHVNHFKLSVSRDAQNWWSYDVYPSLFNAAWNNQWWDYPHLALSNNYLYFTSNLFDGNVAHSVMARVSLSSLETRSSIYFQYYDPGGAWRTITPVQGATDTMYFGKLDPNSNDHMIIYKWPDSSGSIETHLRPIAAYTAGGTMTCPSPDGKNWCQWSDNRITSGWIWNNLIGFFWNVAQGGDFRYPYVDAATFRSTDLSYVDRPLIWSSNHAWMYAASSPDARGLGIAAYFGGGVQSSGYYPTINIMIADDSVSCCPTAPYRTWFVASSTDGGGFVCSDGSSTNTACPAGTTATGRWGDYIRIRPLYIESSNHWIGTGFVDISNGNFVNRFFVFGDDRDGSPPYLTAESSQTITPIR